MIDTIIFDMDGVIVDSEKYWRNPEFGFVKEIFDSLDDEENRKLIGMPITETYILLKSQNKINMTEKEFIGLADKDALIIYKERTSLLPNIKKFIKQAKKEGFKLAIASSSPMNWIDMVIERFDLEKYFEQIVSAIKAECKGKPEPDVFLYTAKQMNKKPENCLVIEDSENGILSAKRAGMKCIALVTGSNNEHDVSKADLIVRDFNEIDLDKIKRM